MKIVSKSLYPYVKRALEKVKREYGADMGLLVYGCWLEVGDNADGEVAIFRPVREVFNIDNTEKAIKSFLGDVDDESAKSAVTIMLHKKNEWAIGKEALLRTFGGTVQGSTDPDAAAQMTTAQQGRDAAKGSAYGGLHFDDIPGIAEAALSQQSSIVLRIAKENPAFWDGHITVDIIKSDLPQEYDAP